MFDPCCSERWQRLCHPQLHHSVAVTSLCVSQGARQAGG